MFSKEQFLLIKKKFLNIRGILILAILGFFSIFLLKNTRIFGRIANNENGNWRYLFCGLFLLMLWTVMHFWMTEGRKKEKKQIEILRMCIYAVFFGTTWHYTLECIFLIDNTELLFSYGMLSIAIAMIVFCILFLVTHSLKAAVIIGSILYFVWGVAEYYTQLYRGLPMQITDILDVGTAMDVAGNFEFELTAPIIFFFIYLVLIAINICIEDDYVIGIKLWQNLLARGMGIILAVWGIWYLMFTQAFENWGVDVNGNIPLVSFRTYGTQLAFLYSTREIIIQEPEGYSVEELEEIAAQYEAEEKTDSDQVKPNIIAIMNETFADLEILGDIETSEEVLPNYKALKENAITGNIMVSTLGGGTGKSEYEFLTGNSMHLYSAALSPYVMLGNKMENSLASTLNKQGYTTYAMHPYTATNYNRENTYATMGFQDFVSIEDFQDAEKERGFVTDEECYDKIFELMEQTEDPMFTFCVTIQNHSPYTITGYESTIQLIETDNAEVEQYLSLIHESDKQIVKLTEYLENSNEPTVVVFFGDHFPQLADEFWESVTGIPKEQEDFQLQQKYYVTPFFIWANYDIEEQCDLMLGSNSLGSYALQTAGVELSGYNKYLLDLQTQIPAFSAFAYYGTDEKFHEFGENEQVDEAIRIYDTFQYNEIFDNKGKLKEFY